MTGGLQVEVSYRQVVKIAAPIALALFVPQLNLITNSIFLGHHSEESLAVAASNRRVLPGFRRNWLWIE